MIQLIRAGGDDAYLYLNEFSKPNKAAEFLSAALQEQLRYGRSVVVFPDPDLEPLSMCGDAEVATPAELRSYLRRLGIRNPERYFPKPKKAERKVRRPFKWVTHKGDLVDPADMATPHLFYALRMIFNHSVPEEYQTPPLSETEKVRGINRYGDVPSWPDSYKKAAVKALAAELNERNPKGLLPGMADQLRWMELASKALLFDEAQPAR
jgi:hypothetical protein